MLHELTALSPTDKAFGLVCSAPLIYLLTVAVGRFLKHKAGVQLGFMYKLFGVALGIYLPLWLLNLNAGQHPYDLRNDMLAASIMLGVVFALSLLRRWLWEYYFGERRGLEIPKFLREIFTALFFIAALLITISHIYPVTPSSVVFSSTVVVGVIGWAMQDLLGNVISGVALQIGKPFKSGDWLILDTQHAEVIEVNWRSTKLRTNDDHYLDVPNSTIVRTTILNLSYPTHLHAMRMRVGVAYDAPPNRVKQVLLQAAQAAGGVLAHPPPKIFLVDFADSAVTYEIKYWMQNHAAYNDTNDALRTSVWYALQRAHIAIPFPIRTVQIERKAPAKFQLPEDKRAVIRKKPFFKCLTDEQVQKIVGTAQVCLFGHGECIVEQGAEGSSMFILLTGEASVFVKPEGRGAEATRVATLQPGDYFGEMSLLTGEKRSASVVAGVDCQVLEVTKAQLAPLLQENASLANALSEMLAQRRMDNEGLLATNSSQHAGAAKKEEYRQGFLKKVAWFFEL